MTTLASGLNSLLSAYLQAVVIGDDAEASSVIAQALAARIPPDALYLSVLVPAQYEIGVRWLQGTLTVAEEHRATLITERQMNVLRAASRRRAPIGHRAVVTAVDGERHVLGARILSDFLYLDGWEVHFLGGSLPVDELRDFVARNRPSLVALSVTLIKHLEPLREAIAALRALPDRPRILVGGAALAKDHEAADRLGADALAQDVQAGISVAREMVGLSNPGALTSRVLADIAAHVQAERKARDWSQRELAEAAGIDRAHVSALENGRANPTIDTLVRVAHALGITIGHLISGGPSSQHWSSPRRRIQQMGQGSTEG
ncbi:MAG: helix-turn-helix domain-containing protein [SAR202 cluster bacterium]|nr:helix-turn-helix domain-containing protein [SAR202 cluster bacterium]